MRYKRKVVAFIDILGFRKIIEQTEENLTAQSEIYDVLNSIKTSILSTSLSGELNLENVPPEELEDVQKTFQLFAYAMKSKSTVQITHFSDSIVISVDADDMVYVMTVMELIGRTIFKLWNDFKILIRGAISTGYLIHEEEGVLFGPAMVKSYEYETFLAKNPRIIIDEETAVLLKSNNDYQNNGMHYLFANFNDSVTIKDKKYEINNGLEINLATTCEYFIRSHHSQIPELRKKYFDCINSTPQKLEDLKQQLKDTRVKEKYQYLLEAFKTHFPK